MCTVGICSSSHSKKLQAEAKSGEFFVFRFASFHTKNTPIPALVSLVLQVKAGIMKNIKVLLPKSSNANNINFSQNTILISGLILLDVYMCGIYCKSIFFGLFLLIGSKGINRCVQRLRA